MKIVYVSDNYTWDNFGTKRSMFIEINNRPGFELIWCNITDIDSFIENIETDIPDQIWLSHSGLTISDVMKNKLNLFNVTVVGIGMSDPNYFTPDRLKNYDAY